MGILINGDYWVKHKNNGFLYRYRFRFKKILPKELQQKESVDKESQTEILTESTVSEHKKLNNNMMDLTETDGKKRLFPTTDHFEPKSNLGQMKPLEKNCV